MDLKPPNTDLPNTIPREWNLDKAPEDVGAQRAMELRYFETLKKVEANLEVGRLPLVVLEFKPLPSETAALIAQKYALDYGCNVKDVLIEDASALENAVETEVYFQASLTQTERGDESPQPLRLSKMNMVLASENHESLSYRHLVKVTVKGQASKLRITEINDDLQSCSIKDWGLTAQENQDSKEGGSIEALPLYSHTGRGEKALLRLSLQCGVDIESMKIPGKKNTIRKRPFEEAMDPILEKILSALPINTERGESLDLMKTSRGVVIRRTKVYKQPKQPEEPIAPRKASRSSRGKRRSSLEAAKQRSYDMSGVKYEFFDIKDVLGAVDYWDTKRKRSSSGRSKRVQIPDRV